MTVRHRDDDTAFPWITLVSLLVVTEPNLGDHKQTRNTENVIKLDTRKHARTCAKTSPRLQNLYTSVRFRPPPPQL